MKDEPQAPDDTFARRRWIPRHRVDWVRECDRIMLEHGSVVGSITYEKRHQARWRAQYLIKLMDELELHRRWELGEHTERKGDGWIWVVEYLGRSNDRAATAA